MLALKAILFEFFIFQFFRQTLFFESNLINIGLAWCWWNYGIFYWDKVHCGIAKTPNVLCLTFDLHTNDATNANTAALIMLQFQSIWTAVWQKRLNALYVYHDSKEAFEKKIKKQQFNDQPYWHKKPSGIR